MMATDRVLPLARQLLTIEVDESHQDLWLWEHSERVMRLAARLVGALEIDPAALNLDALLTAAMFHDAGWAVEHQQGRWNRWQLLSRPTNEIQRELAAAMLQEETGHLLPAATVGRAAEAIRHCNDRRADLLEARILNDAEALDEMSPMYVLRQFRLYQGEGRPVAQLADTWERLREYRYWDVRLNDSFRFDRTRALARQRLAAVDAFMTAVRHALDGGDVPAPAGTPARPTGSKPSKR